MSDNTLLQFGGAPVAPTEAHPQQRVVRRCPACQQHFSSDARFCPFDGEPLVEAAEYDPTSDPLIGSIVDHRYEIKHVLGEGGMGIVYGVRHVTLGKAFALKALRADLSRDGEIAERFIGEARTAATISHPGLVEITDFGTMADGRPYFVMELLDGQPLSWFIHDGGAIPAARAVGIVRQVAEAVGAAHRMQVVHRDLKPDNVYVMADRTGADRVKVLDFGLAKVMGGGRRTRDGVVFGTPHYMSPEQAAGEEVDHRADIYSLGIVLYELLTGRVPFEADSFMGVLSKHIYMQPTPPSQVVSPAPDVGALESVVLRCLEKKREDRYQSFDEFLLDLDRAVAGSSPLLEFSHVSVASRRDPPGSGTEVSIPGRDSFPQVSSLWPLAAGFGLVVIVALGFVAVRAWLAPAPVAIDTAQSASAALRVLAAPPQTAPALGSVVALPPPPAPPLASARAKSPGQKPAKAATGAVTQTRPSSDQPEPVRPHPPRKPLGIRGEIIDPWSQ